MAQASDFNSDLQYAWDSLGKENLSVEEAPNQTAWFLWSWGRGSPDKFIPMVSRILGKKEDDGREAMLKDDAAKQLDLLSLFGSEDHG